MQKPSRSLKSWTDLRHILAVSLILACSYVAEAETRDLKVHFIDVGTGDCIWIQTADDGIPGNGQREGLNVFIDGGDIGAFGRIKAYDLVSDYLFQGAKERLSPNSTIHCMVLTHPHSDHLGGLLGLLKDYEVRLILDPGFDKLDEEGEPDREDLKSAYGKFFHAASTEMWKGPSGESRRAEYLWGIPEGMKSLDWGGELKVDILHSSREILDEDLNNVSIVIRLTYGDVSFLFMGDAEKFVESRLVVRMGNSLRSTVLKVGHHGSDSSSTIEFIKAVTPKFAIISSGNQKFSGVTLPKPGTLQRLQEGSPNVQIFRTDREDVKTAPVGTEGGDDTIVAITDGQTISVKYLSDSNVAPSFVGLPAVRCSAITKQGSQCKRMVDDGNEKCWQHR